MVWKGDVKDTVALTEAMEGVDAIAESGIAYTLIRAAHLTDGNNDEYHLQNEGEKLRSNAVDRMAVARFIRDIIVDDTGKYENKSIGITN